MPLAGTLAMQSDERLSLCLAKRHYIKKILFQPAQRVSCTMYMKALPCMQMTLMIVIMMVDESMVVAGTIAFGRSRKWGWRKTECESELNSKWKHRNAFERDDVVWLKVRNIVFTFVECLTNCYAMCSSYRYGISLFCEFGPDIFTMVSLSFAEAPPWNSFSHIHDKVVRWPRGAVLLSLPHPHHYHTLGLFPFPMHSNNNKLWTNI